MKDESNRLGLPAFKILGPSWAIYRALVERFAEIRQKPLGQITEFLKVQKALRLVCATDGNHGRAVARVGKILGVSARIHMPQGTARARIEAIHSEGAEVIVGGSYDEAVFRAAAEAEDNGLLIQDTAWNGYTQIPEWIIQGYLSLFWEIDDALQAMRVEGPTHVVVQMGVGSLADAAVRHYRRASLESRPVIIGVEPVKADCILASVKAGRVVQLSGHQDSIMAGLNCGTPSILSFPTLQKGIDCFVTIEDDRAREAMRLLAQEEMIAGETGAAGFGGLLELLSGKQAEEVRSRLRLDESARVLLLNTEGATDPESYERIVGKPALR